MPINHTELLSVAQTIVEDENLQVTVKETMKGGCIAAGGAIMGGLLGGPVGMAIGGTVCSIYAGVRSSGKFKSVASVIMEDLTAAQREQLATSIQRAIQDIDVQDAIMLTTLAMGNSAVKQLILKQVVNFMSNEMGLAIAQ